MLLRRVIEHVKSQSWAAIGIDFVIVVVGVFIGIQVSNWNDDLENQRIAADYVERLKADLVLEVGFWQRNARYIEATRGHTIAALDAYEKDASDLDVEFLIDLYQASQRINVIAQKGTYDELLATGRIINIANEETRAIFRNHYERVDSRNSTMEERGDYRTTIREYMNHDVQMTIRKHCGDTYVVTNDNVSYIQLPEHCSIELPKALVDSEVRRLLVNEVVRRQLRFQLSLQDSKLGSIGAGAKTAQATLDAIANSGS